MSASEKSPLARLVLFMICLSIAGSLVAGFHYFTVDLPYQNTVPVPANSQGSADCLKDCHDGWGFCNFMCFIYCDHCVQEYNACCAKC